MDMKGRIKKAGTKWYQTIEMDGVMTRKPGGSDVEVWNAVRETIFPPRLDGMKVLDLGCNAGHFSCLAAVLGAKVVGIDLPMDKLKRQTKLVKEHFEEKHGSKLDIKYIWSDIINVDFDALGYFDYVLAFAILYHIGRQFGNYTPKCLETQKQTIAKIQTDKFIVRTRQGKFNSVKYYDDLFKELGFTRTKAARDIERRDLVLYER